MVLSSIPSVYSITAHAALHQHPMAGRETTNTSSSMAPSDTPLHLSTAIEPGQFNEKIVPLQAVRVADDDEVEDMDALIDELESHDGHEDVEAEGEVATPGTVRVVPEELLQTDTRVGLTEAEVHVRRKKFGMNQMEEEKENLILKFLGYFIGPIQFVMEVSVVCIVLSASCAFQVCQISSFFLFIFFYQECSLLTPLLHRLLPCLLPVSKTG